MPLDQNEKDLRMTTSMIYLMDLSCLVWMRWICQQEVWLKINRDMIVLPSHSVWEIC